MKEILKDSNKSIRLPKEDFPNGESYWKRAKKHFKCPCGSPILDFSKTGLCQKCINKNFPKKEYSELWRKKK